MGGARLLVVMAVLLIAAVGCAGDPVERAESSVPTPAIDGGTPPSSGATMVLSVGTHCGLEVLGRLVDGSVWRTDEADGPDWVPREWYSGPVPPDPIDLEVSLSEDGAVLTASLNGRVVTYERNGQAFTEEDQCA